MLIVIVESKNRLSTLTGVHREETECDGLFPWTRMIRGHAMAVKDTLDVEPAS